MLHMKSKKIKYSVFIIILCFMTACSQPNKEITHAFIGFKHLPKINLNVKDINININIPALEKPTIERKDARDILPISFEAMINSWVDDRLNAKGKNGYIDISVEELTFYEYRRLSTSADSHDSFQDAFLSTFNETLDSILERKIYEYKANIRIIVNGVHTDDFNTQKTAKGVIAINRDLILPDGLSFNKLQEYIYKMEEGIAEDLNDQFELILDNYFNEFQL